MYTGTYPVYIYSMHIYIYRVLLVVQLSGRRLTQVSVDKLAVVHLSSHGSDLLQLGLLGVHTFLQPLQLLCFRLNHSTRV